MKTKFKQDSHRLRKLETLLNHARKKLLYDNSEKAVIEEIKKMIKVWEFLDKNKK